MVAAPLLMSAVGCASLDRALSPRESKPQIHDAEVLKLLRALEERWEREPVPVGLERQVFYDDALVSYRSEGIVRRLGDYVRLNDGDHVFALDEREYLGANTKGNIGYSSVLFEDGVYKIWYQFGGDHGRLGYAESRDGLAWRKMHGGVLRPYIKATVHGPGIMRDPNAHGPWDRYKMVHGMGSGRGVSQLYGLTFARSRTGRSWRDYGEPYPINNVRSDTANSLMWDESIRRYRVCSRLGDTSGGRGYIQLVRPYISPGVLRTVAYAIFIPFVASPWQEVDTHVLPDHRRQIYASHMQKDQNIYIGYFSVLEDGEYHFYVAFSRSGINWDWQWIDAGQRFIRAGPSGAFDEYGQFHVSSPMITKGDHHYIFYKGWARPHGVAMGLDEEGPRTSLGIAAFRRDGLAYLENESGEGHVRTKRFVLKGNRLEVNASVGSEVAGETSLLQIEVLDAQGKPVAGYSRAESKGIREDGLRLVAEWGQSRDLSALQGKEIYLVFHMTGQVRLYAFQIRVGGTPL